MPSLSQCLAKAGDLIPAAARDAVLARAQELEDAGAQSAKAAKQAVQEVLDSQAASRAEIEAAVKEGRTLYEDAPKAEEGADPLTRIAQESPDALVTLPGKPDPVRLSEAVELARAEADEERFMAELVRVAGECALSFN